jgi:hypothetical protein
MRKGTAIFFLSIFLFSNTEVHELGKIGAFINHYQEHRSADPAITLLEFIHIHYFNGNIHDEDYDRDMQLPFKVIDCAAPGIVFTLPSDVVLALTPPFPTLKNKACFSNQPAFQSSHLSDIWQPPKSC